MTVQTCSENPSPLVSVIMNCYNGERYLTEAIDSVLSQTYTNWEIVFWDNQSTDRSAQIVQSCEDSRVRYFSAPRHTLLYEARNFAINEARGDFIAFLDVDDRWLPEKLERQIQLFSDPEVGLVCGNFWVQNELRGNRRRESFRRHVPTGWVLNDLLKRSYVGMPTLVVRRAALDALDYPCNPRYHIIGDLDLVIRLAIDWKLEAIQEPVAVYRIHGDNESAKHRNRYVDEMKHWLAEMADVEAIQSCPNAASIRRQVTFEDAVYCVLQQDRKRGYDLFRTLPWSPLKLKLLLVLISPTAVSRKWYGWKESTSQSHPHSQDRSTLGRKVS